MSTIVVPGLVLTSASLAKAQPQGSDYDSVARYCDNAASDLANRQASGDQVIGGAVEGAIGGLVLGSIFGGNGGRGAVVGAALGSLGGVNEENQERTSIRRNEYDRCMKRNGY